MVAIREYGRQFYEAVVRANPGDGKYFEEWVRRFFFATRHSPIWGLVKHKSSLERTESVSGDVRGAGDGESAGETGFTAEPNDIDDGGEDDSSAPTYGPDTPGCLAPESPFKDDWDDENFCT